MKKKRLYSSMKKSSNKKIEKKKQTELKLCSELEIRDLKFKLRGNPVLSKDTNLIKLIVLLKTLNGVNPINTPSSYYISEDTKIEALQIVKKILEILKNINIFLFYFKHYKIDDRIIQRIIPNLKYNFYQKDELVFKEGDLSNKFYFLLKGKISFRKKTLLLTHPEPQMIEKFTHEEGAHFGEWDIIYERKKKTSAVCVEDCHIISVDRDTFKEYFEGKLTKVEAEVKNMLKNFLMKYMTLPAIKIERFIQTNIETLFFKRNEVIYREGDNNSFLFMINNGEANLIQNFSKAEYSFLMKYQYPSEYIKNMAKRIDYRGVIKNAFGGNDNNDNNDNNNNNDDNNNDDNNNDNNENNNDENNENNNENNNNNEIENNGNSKENEKNDKDINDNNNNQIQSNIKTDNNNNNNNQIQTYVKQENNDNKNNNDIKNDIENVNHNENNNEEQKNNNNDFNFENFKEDIILDNKEDNIDKNNDDSLKLDLLLERRGIQNIVSLNRGSIGGLEICTGITKFKYSLISNSDFTSVFKIDLRPLDGEHLTEFMLNLLPMFIDFERKIHLQIKKLKFIDSNLLPESCQKYNKKNNTENYYFKDEENDEIHIKNIQKIDTMFQFNEGGFIKMNNYNMRLHKKKNELKEILKDNSRKDKKTELFLKEYVNEQNSKLKFRGMKTIRPIIPNYEIIDNRYDNINFKNKDNNKEDDIKPSGTYYALVNGKNYYYLIDNNLLLGKPENKLKYTNRNNVYSKKSQEMFDRLLPKSYFRKYRIQKKRVTSLKLHRLDSQKINYKQLFINDNNYMRDLIVQRNKNNIHCYDMNIVKFKNKISKSLPKIGESNDKLYTLNNNYHKKKMTFYDTGKYDIPLLTEINNF